MPSQYIVVLLLGLYSIPYRSITVDEFKSLFHHLGLESLFNSVRISRVFDQINPLSKGHYIVGNKIQLLLVLCPDTFHFIFDIQNEFKKHFFNKKICNKIINRLNNIEKIKYDYKTNNSFPFPSCCDRLKYLLFNITNPYQFDYFLPDYDEDNNNNNNNDYEVNLNIKHTYCCITAFLGYQLGQDGYIRTQTEHPVPKRSYFQSIMPLLKNEGDNKAIDIIKKYCHTKYSLRDWKEFLTELIESLCPCNMWMLNCLDNNSS